jgi:hypothetical protein
MAATVQLKKKVSGRESQGVWRQDELIGGKTASRKVTLTLTLEMTVKWLRIDGKKGIRLWKEDFICVESTPGP